LINSGFLLINKPIGKSSYGCIGYIKYIAQQKLRIGHAGTLDPFASGLLIIALGREATRLLPQCMAMEKTYVAKGMCGELTDTLDRTGAIVATSDTMPSEQVLRQSLDSFGSSYEQIPPLYSALKHQGRPMYLLARNKLIDQEQLQEIADAKRRTIQLYKKQFLSYEPPYFTIQVRVSQGTYIRTLVNDIAVQAGSCATTYELVRTAIGPFTLADAVDLHAITSIDDLNARIIPSDLFFKQ